ncbi:MAG: RadC family protein [Bacteroidota bacterium]
MYDTKSTIKSWAEDDRPREKMQEKGRAALTNAELIAILLGSGTRSKTAVDVGQEILSSTGNSLYKLGHYSQGDLTRFSGVGKAKAITLIAAMELGRRRSEEAPQKKIKIAQSRDVYRLMRPYFADLQHEEFRVIGLSRANHVIGQQLVSKGGRSGTIADGKLIFKELLDMKATACILCHNHPSGTLRPSEADVRLTKQMHEFGRLIELKVLDHVIFTDEGHYSLLENGDL